MSRAAAVVGLLLAGCGLPEAEPFVRVVDAEPSGAGVPPELAAASVGFSAPVSGEGLLDGRRMVLAPADALRGALTAVESEEGAVAFPQAIPAHVTLEDGGRRAVLRPTAALRARTAHVLVISSRLRAADGRPVLDAEGRRRPSVATFETGAAAGPPPRPVITEVRARATTPEAGGEYVVLANLGEGPLDLHGHRLAKRTASGAVSSCALGGAVLPPGGTALAVGGAYDGRYATPPEVALLPCGSTALLGGLANDKPPEVMLLDPLGATVATFGRGGVAPVCPAAVVKIDPGGADEAGNLGCK